MQLHGLSYEADSRWAFLGLPAILAVAIIYHMIVAYHKYLRFEHSIATVLTSQFLACLVVYTMYMAIMYW